MEISAKDVMALRQKTGAGMMDCKKALTECEGDKEKAAEQLRKQGMAAAAKRAGRETSNGYVAVYVHPGAQLAAMVQVNCETDFVARNEDFRKFAENLAMHVAATNPLSISEKDIDPEVIAKEREIYRGQALNEGKKEEFVEKIVDGRMKKFFAENSLLHQVYIKDETRKTTINDMIKNLIGVIGENITVSRFSRFSIGS